MADEEVTEDKNPRIMQASSIGEEVAKHYEEMALCAKLQPNEAFAVPKLGFKLKLLRDLAEDLSTGKKAFVVFEHDDANCFEVRRLPDGQSPKRYYSVVALPEIAFNVGNDVILSAVIEKIEAAFERPYEETQQYEPKFSMKWKDERIISYSMLHRQISSLAAFRKSKEGATVALKNAIATLIETKYLTEVPQSFAEANFGTTAQVYRASKERKN